MKTIRIGDGKYVLVIENEEDLDLDRLEWLGEALQRWWESSRKFFIVHVPGDAKVRFERMEDE